VRIVVVDDDPLLGALLTEFLADEGHEVRVVRSHAEALAACELIACDAFLVDGFGPTATVLTAEHRAILQTLEDRAPVIIISGHSWLRRLSLKEIGVEAVLLKPFELDELLGILKRVGSQPTEG
jgi:DNA-binding response OmpR family regulator